MRIDVVTLFPEMLEGVANYGVVGRAIQGGAVDWHCWNPRDFAGDRHRTVDDRPYGGGPGMVLKVEPLGSTVLAARAAADPPARVTYLSPQGRRLTQRDVEAIAQRERLLLVCGRYEGVDERFVEAEVDEELSIGDYVLSGGELAAAVVIDAVVRLLPGVLGADESAVQDSYADGLLDCPHYTRPEVAYGRRPPEVLLSGDHEAIRRWRRKQALRRTWLRRPDLLALATLSDEDAELLAELERDNDNTGPEIEGPRQARGRS